MKKSDSITALVLSLSLLSPLLTAAAQEKAAPPAPAPAQSAPRQPSAANPITEAAAKGGVLACTGRIDQVSNFLTEGSQGAGATLFTPPADPDRRLFSISMEIPVTNGPSAYATASFAPNQANGCGGMYETVVYWPQVCDLVAAKNYSTLKRTGTLSKTIAVLGGAPATTIFLMPAGTGCVSIKKEVVQ
jgi:hypothetical protein